MATLRRAVRASLLLIGSLGGPAEGQQGRVLEAETLESRLLDREWAYSIYLPPDYETSSRAYPVVYLLHGAGGGHTDWLRRGGASITADSLFGAGRISPAILVMPDGRGFSGWMDSDLADGFGPVESALIEELVPHIDENYRTIPTRRGRVIAGLSMGGFGALRLAFRHPDLFAATAGLSSAWLIPGLPAGLLERVGLVTRIFGENYRQRWEEEVPSVYVESLPADGPNRLHVYLMTGDDDRDHIVSGTTELYLELREAGVPTELRITDGAHEWPVWDKGLIETLLFFDEVLRSRR